MSREELWGVCLTELKPSLWVKRTYKKKNTWKLSCRKMVTQDHSSGSPWRDDHKQPRRSSLTEPLWWFHMWLSWVSELGEYAKTITSEQLSSLPALLELSKGPYSHGEEVWSDVRSTSQLWEGVYWWDQEDTRDKDERVPCCSPLRTSREINNSRTRLAGGTHNRLEKGQNMRCTL